MDRCWEASEDVGLTSFIVEGERERTNLQRPGERAVQRPSPSSPSLRATLVCRVDPKGENPS